MYNFSAGFFTGLIATIFSTPFDVVKTRMQHGMHEKAIGNWTLPSMWLIAAEEGFFSLMRGLMPRIIRLAPGGGIMYVVFEGLSRLFNDKK
jgi:solute carrier family 25 2-oxodicarboxylate transporter 21